MNYNGGKAIPVIGKRSYKGHPEKVGKKGPKDPKNHRLGAAVSGSLPQLLKQTAVVALTAPLAGLADATGF